MTQIINSLTSLCELRRNRLKLAVGVKQINTLLKLKRYDTRKHENKENDKTRV